MIYTKHQNKAINHEGENILVSASAGSGKTGVLKARVLRKLNDGVDIDQLIILTFTEAAAAEMKSRIIDELKKNHMDHQLVKLDNAIISTFDAFTLRLVREYHYLLKLPADIQISDTLLIQMESDIILQEVIKDFYLENTQEFRQLVKLLFSGNDHFLEQGILNLARAFKKIPNYFAFIESYDQHFKPSMLEKAYDEFFAFIHQDLQVIRDKFYDYYQDNYRSYSLDCDLYLDQCLSIYNALAKEEDPQTIMDLLDEFSLPRKPVKPRNTDDWLESFDQGKKLIKKIKEEIQASQLGQDKAYIKTWENTLDRVQVILKMTHQYLLKLRQVQIQKNLYFFDDIMAFAIDLFKNHQDIRQKYQENINEILIDEYQDTNDLQDYLISLIANNNVFMVGDVKQSIYRFRDANPKNFMRILETYQKTNQGMAINLIENFRSNKYVLEKINDMFLEIMTIDKGGVNYSDNHQLVSGYDDDFGLNKKNDPLHIHYYDPKTIKIKQEDLSKDQIEAHIVAKDILRKMKKRQRIFTGKAYRPIEYSDITILVDRKNAFDTYAKVLGAYQIPVDIYDKTSFIQSEEMIFIHQFLILLNKLRNNDSQAFKQSLYAVARSFVYGIPDQEIIHYLISTKADIQAFLKDQTFDLIKNDLLSILEFINIKPNVNLIDMIYQKTKIYEKIAYLDKPKNRAKKLEYFRHLIGSQKEKKFEDMIDYLAFIDQRDDLDIEYKESKENIQAIKLMSIHQSKGLQFPVLYMIGLSKKFNFTENKEVFNFSPDYGILTYSNDQGIYRNFLERLFFKKAKAEDSSEKIRLFYVALTRAKEEINLVLEAKEELNLVKTTYNNYLEMLYDAYHLEPTDIIMDIENPEIQVTSDQDYQQKSISYKKFDFTEDIIDQGRYSKAENTFFTDQVKVALNYGQNIHSLLESIDFNHLYQSMDTLPENIRKSMIVLSDSSLFKSLKEPTFYKEYEFIDQESDQLRQGIIDLLIMDIDKVIIIDYKLKNIDDLAYYDQLNGYESYLKKMTDKPIYGYLYSLIDQELKQMI
ncbi:MAG: UvrD-helicase domain-containing protein [Candidatus Izemoplasmatales bacterium]